ncbi:hypothetical protein ACSQ76_11290 [Roseovarius sp. B08]|uniref:hypothetical protein n=1 Tax=Roseovarius sp. B08 TaxID=3449223 RepID=UPI003EDBC07A
MWSDLQNPVLQVIPDVILPAPGLIRGDLLATRGHPVPGLTRDLMAPRTLSPKGFAPPPASPQRAFGACMSIFGKKEPGDLPGPEAA